MGGIMRSMKHASHRRQVTRLKRIQGQVGGLVRMVEDERYCVDILTQIRAVRAALKTVEHQVLQEHVRHCVAGAVASDLENEGHEKLDELFQVLARYAD